MASVWNPWRGCQRHSEGCKYCYIHKGDAKRDVNTGRVEKTLADFYSSFLGMPAPGTTLPVADFLLLGVYGRVIWLMLSVVILDVGHIGSHVQRRRSLRQ